MPKASHSIALRRKPKRKLIPVYAAILLLIFHGFVVAYINSSYLEQFIEPENVGTIYTVGSAISVLLFFGIASILRRLGNFKFTLSMLIIDLLAVFGMAQADTLTLAIPFFLLHIIAVPVIVFNLDILMEEQIGEDEASTGSRRGLLLTLSSFIGAISPFVSSQLVEAGGGSFDYAYLASAITLLPIIVIIISFFSDFPDPEYHKIKILKALKDFWNTGDVRYVFIAHFALQILFFVLVVYTPLYMVQEIGLSWTDFGVAMFFGQLAYVFLEYPIGLLADKYFGEKEMMGVGFLIIALSLSSLAFITTASVLVWSLVMFVIRIGASLVEVTTESHFFKQTKSSDAQIISFFRVARPLAYVLGALFVSLMFIYLPFNLLFVAVSCLMIPAMFLTLNIVDSR